MPSRRKTRPPLHKSRNPSALASLHAHARAAHGSLLAPIPAWRCARSLEVAVAGCCLGPLSCSAAQTACAELAHTEHHHRRTSFAYLSRCRWKQSHTVLSSWSRHPCTCSLSHSPPELPSQRPQSPILHLSISPTLALNVRSDGVAALFACPHLSSRTHTPGPLDLSCSPSSSFSAAGLPLSIPGFPPPGFPDTFVSPSSLLLPSPQLTHSSRAVPFTTEQPCPRRSAPRILLRCTESDTLPRLL